MRHTFTLDSIHKTYISQISLFTLRKNVQPQVKKALSGVSITLTPGLYGLLGPNGAGKSTLIHIITGTLAPDSGEVLWCGKPASGITFRRILGYTFCTRFCENETNLKVIQDIMGHADITTTMNIYAEATKEKKQQAMANLNGKIKIM